MKAVILCGGRGTRIRDVSETLPKPMLPIGDKPILWHIMKIYAYYGIKDFILCLGYKGWAIKEFFLNYYAKISDVDIDLTREGSIAYHHQSKEELGWKVTLAETGDMSQTGARVWNVREYLKDCDIFSVTYGDGVADVDIRAVVQRHKKSNLLGTVTGVHPSGRFGEIEISGNIVSSFAEKPNVRTGLFNGGFIVFSRAALEKYFRPGEDLSLEAEVLMNMARNKELGIYEHNGFWQCVDTSREYHLLNQMWKENNAPWKIWE